MSAWPGKFVIGLTGNIATGKSVVRKMFEHLGAYGIDADALGHRAIAQGAPGYQAVLDTFGRWILSSDGQIDRGRLARVVFVDTTAMARLEAIVHPLVRQAVDVLIRRSTQKVIVLEAIKLLESPLHQGCDILVVTYASPEKQLARLMQKRGMSEEVARQRINAQPPQQEKVRAAQFVIHNDGSFEDTWKQVQAAWQKLFPAEVEAPADRTQPAIRGALAVEKARPRQASLIATLISKLSRQQRNPTRSDIMAAFGEKAYLLLKAEERPVGLVGWQVENLVARIDDVFIEAGLPLAEAMQKMMEEVESTSRDLQCEAALLFLPPELVRQEQLWSSLGYEKRDIQHLGVRAWQEAAQESMPDGTVMLFKQLRKDRVLRPV